MCDFIPWAFSHPCTCITFYLVWSWHDCVSNVSSPEQGPALRDDTRCWVFRGVWSYCPSNTSLEPDTGMYTFQHISGTWPMQIFFTTYLWNLTQVLILSDTSLQPATGWYISRHISGSWHSYSYSPTHLWNLAQVGIFTTYMLNLTHVGIFFDIYLESDTGITRDIYQDPETGRYLSRHISGTWHR